MAQRSPDPSRVARVISLPVGLVARADAVVDDPSTRYRTLSELVELAVRNQLEMIEGVLTLETSDVRPESSVSSVAAEASGQSAVFDDWSPPSILMPFTSDPSGSAEIISGVEMNALMFLTNRLNPVPLVTRCLANLGPIKMQVAQTEIGAASREIGLRLRLQDHEHSRPMPERKSTSWPIGDDPAKSLLKFNASYLLGEDGTGPLLNLGLARLVNGDVVLTKEGVDLARAPSPLLDETDDGDTVGEEARRILKNALLANPKERTDLMTFFGSITEHEGNQGKVDESLMERHGWNQGLAVSNRAAYVGRLRDLHLVAIQGRGPSARILVTQEASPFVRELSN